MKNTITVNTVAAIFLTLLTACGGGGGSGNSPQPPVVPPVAPTVSYSVGGTVTGLSASGLRLTSAVDLVNVEANATSVSFPTKLLTGAAYNVSIASQPLGFTDFCALSNASGTVANANITNIAVLCRPSVTVVTAFAGGSMPGKLDGMGVAATFDFPSGVAVDNLGNAYVADQSNHLIRKISPAGLVSTFAGSGTIGSADGAGTSASFSFPSDVAVDSVNNVFVSDSGNHKIRKITPTGVVTTVAGSGKSGKIDGPGLSASFFAPVGGVTVDAADNVYVADSGNRLIRKISSAGVVTTLAGSGIYTGGDGVGTAATFYGTNGIASDSAGNLYVADADTIRKVSPSGVVTTLAGTPGLSGQVVNGPGPAAVFYGPFGIAVDRTGNVYVADSNNHAVRMITPTGLVSSIAGVGSANVTGNAATKINRPTGVAVDANGVVYVADGPGHAIVKITKQ